jgi:hypothetical protein
MALANWGGFCWDSPVEEIFVFDCNLKFFFEGKLVGYEFCGLFKAISVQINFSLGVIGISSNRC